MGKYINQTSKGETGSSAKSKCDALLADGAVEISEPMTFFDNLVCVVNNGPFGAAAYAYDKGEFMAFTDPSDPRPKRWFVWDKVKQFSS
jgi:hypothetical protein